MCREWHDYEKREDWGEWKRWCSANGIEREFYRIIPWYEWDDNWNAEKRIVYMDLSIDPEAELRKGHKSSLELSRRSGVTIEHCDELELFRDMYWNTMNRLGADERWNYGSGLLLNLRDAYPDGFQFLLAKVNGEPEAGCILLGAHQTC